MALTEQAERKCWQWSVSWGLPPSGPHRSGCGAVSGVVRWGQTTQTGHTDNQHKWRWSILHGE